VNENGVAVVPAGFGAAVALLKELTRHPTFKENSREEVRGGAQSDPETFRKGVGSILGAELTERLLVACQKDQWTAVHELVPEIRAAVHRTQHSLSATAFAFLLGNIRHHLRPPMSGFVVLLGPDGSGKSTIGDLVADALYKEPFKVCRRFEYNFRIVPELKQFKRGIARLLGRPVAKTVAVLPGTRGSGMTRDHGTLRGMGYVTYYALDFIVGRLLLRKLRGQGALLVFARYFHDYYYQRGYGNVPRWYLRMLELLVPKPDLILYLDRSAQEIYDGKPELDLDEIVRQQQVIKGLVAERAHAEAIDASGGIDETVRQVRERVVGHFLARHGIS
jgi:thymidylate kinase